MVCIGIVALVIASREPEQPPRADGSVFIDTATPEATAESFLDAWRKRRFSEARDIAIGPAAELVAQRLAADENVAAEDKTAQSLWDVLAAPRLRFLVQESVELSGREGVDLRGVVTGDFMGGPYRREVEFVVLQTREGWRVERMALGRILTGAGSAP